MQEFTKGCKKIQKAARKFKMIHEIANGCKIAQEVARKYKRRQEQFRKWKIAQCTRSDKKDKKIHQYCT
jgi:hypothetical protein